MKRTFLSIFLVLTYIANAIAQTNNGISEKMIQEMQLNLKKDASYKARINAITNNEQKGLALNRENYSSKDHFFSNVVKSKGISDQKSSGRCWLFTGLNFLRSKMFDKIDVDEFFFSQNYLFFWDQLEKSNLFLEGIIATREKKMDDRTVEFFLKNPIGDGGQWSMFADLVKKYGVVPKNIMPETKQSENTSAMSNILSSKLREFAIEIREPSKKNITEEVLQKRKLEMLSDIYKILTFNLGEPPSNFNWRYKDKNGKISEEKNYTPKSFYDDMIGLDLADYILLMNDPTRSFNQLYEIEYDRNMIDGNNWKYINISISDIREFAKKSILANEAMYFSCDVGKQLNSNDGFLDLKNYDYESLYGIKFSMNKAQRIATYESGSSHAMLLTGLDMNKDNVVSKWMIENSWGSEKGNKGYLTMTDEWFGEYMFRLVINKKFVSQNVIDIQKQKPTMLPPWDPMFSSEE